MGANLSMPECAIIPALEYPDVPAAVKCLSEAFAFEVRVRIGAHRAQLQFGGAVVSQVASRDLRIRGLTGRDGRGSNIACAAQSGSISPAKGRRGDDPSSQP